MSRAVVDLESTKIQKRFNSECDKLQRMLGDLAEVKAPGDAEEPILAESVRKAIVSWLVELNNANFLSEVGVKPRSTALLFGPPGCGKTTLAHHLAARLGVPLVCVGSENIISMYMGESEGKLAKLFNTLASAETRCVLFFDEIEAIGGDRRGNSNGGADNARNSLMTVLLRKTEEFNGIMIGATNLADKLDPAFWRRFGMQIDVALPGDDERYAILRRYAAPFDLSDDAFELLTDLTAGAAPSLLRQLMEGMKRLLVVGQEIGVKTDTPDVVFRAVLSQNKPHPDYAPPPLWRGEGMAELSAIAWPPVRENTQ